MTTKRKPGRPKSKHPLERRVIGRVLPETAKAMSREAERKGVTVSQIVRFLCEDFASGMFIPSRFR
jgi:hypothetical protein